MNIAVFVDVQNVSGAASVPADADIRAWTSLAVNGVHHNASSVYEIVVRVVDEPEGRELNRKFRQQDKATNVLSFPADNETLAAIPDADPRPLGDLVICGPVVEREAAEQNKDPASHWGHLLVHGTLHLLGYDHDSAAQAARMEAIERQLLAERGIADPYTVA